MDLKTLPVEDTKAAFFIEQRARLNLDYSLAKYSIGFATGCAYMGKCAADKQNRWPYLCT
jgi:hypothetical protein